MLLLQHPGSLSLARIHPKLKTPFHLGFAVAIAVYLGTVYNCMQCTANKDTANGTTEILTLCQCDENVLVWYGITLLGLGVEMVAWKPWKRLRSMCSCLSWKVGFVQILSMLLTAVVLLLDGILLTGAASVAFYTSAGLIESDVDATVLWINSAVATLVMINQNFQWHAAVDAIAKFVEDPDDNNNNNNNDVDEAEVVEDAGRVATLLNRLIGVQTAAKAAWKGVKATLEVYFGPYIFHVKLISFEMLEVFLQFQYMFSVLNTVPYNEWLMVMVWLTVALLSSVLTVAIPWIREQTWSLKLLYAIEGFSDLIYLWFNLYSLQYLTARSTIGNVPTLSATTQFLFKLQLGLINSGSIWDTLSMYLTMARLSYLAKTLLDYVIERSVHVPEAEAGGDVDNANGRRRRSSVLMAHAAALLEENNAGEAREDDGVLILADEDQRSCVKSCGKWFACVGYLFAALVTLATVGSMLVFVPQYFVIRDQCLAEWGEAAVWCSVTVYHPEGLFNEPSCGCRVITVPNCNDGLNKTLPGEVFEKLGSDVTFAFFGGTDFKATAQLVQNSNTISMDISDG